MWQRFVLLVRDQDWLAVAALRHGDRHRGRLGGCERAAYGWGWEKYTCLSGIQDKTLTFHILRRMSDVLYFAFHPQQPGAFHVSLFQVDKQLIVTIMDKYLKLAQHLVLANIETDDYAVFLFGSRATGKRGRGADIDIGLLGTQPVAEKTIEYVRELLENSIIPYPIDIVDFNRVSGEFKEQALKKIQVWNRPKHIALN